jgi:WASH complex subunit strumpellin
MSARISHIVSCLIVIDLTDFVRLYRRTITKPVKEFVHKLTNELLPTSQFPVNAQKLYTVAQTKTQKLWPIFLEFVTKIGQSQLIRRQIANELNVCSHSHRTKLKK